MMPSQKFGVDRPQSANDVGARSPTPCRASPPTTMPAGMPIDERDRHRQHRELDRHRQLLQRSARAPAAGCAPTRRDRRAARRRSSTRSAPAAARRGAASRADTRRRSGRAPRRPATIAGSPGSSCCRPKISIDTNTSVGTIVREAAGRGRRASTYLSAVSRGLRSGAVSSSSSPVTRSSPSGHAAHARQLRV